MPWATLISAAGQAMSGLFSKINNDKMQSEQEAESARQQAYYNAKANENPLARSENQQVLNQYDRKAQQQVENARNVAKITGATPEYSLAVQKGVAQGRADLMSNIAAGASAQKDKYDELAEKARHERSANEIARRNERNTTFANLASNAANAFGSIVGAYTGGSDKTTTDAGTQSTPTAQEAPAKTSSPTSQQLATASAKAGGTSTPEGQVFHDMSQAKEKMETGGAATSAASPTPEQPDPNNFDFMGQQEWDRYNNKMPWEHH